MSWESILSQATTLRALTIVLVALVVYQVVVFATKHLRTLALLEPNPAVRSQRQQRAETLREILNNFARVVLLVLVVVTLLSQLGIDIRPIIAGAGIVGIAIGFGAQSLVRDYLSGFFIVFENHFGIGDHITVAGHTGSVERMTLRSTVLRDGEGAIHIVPNGKIESVVVVSNEWARADVDVTVPYDQEITRALDAVASECLAIGEEYHDALVEPPAVLGIDQFAASGSVIRATVRAKPGRQNAVARALRLRIKSAFEREKIRLQSGAAASPPAEPRSPES
ncbi:MAG TPA: mechanosensitive ion channel family protein [Blastocatellia bacterium]|nr:mechanosensitive ion channel family protein [Blastocatellia bacterium]